MKRLQMGAVLWLAAAAPSFCGEITDAAAKAEALFGEGKYQESLDALNAARDVIWAKAPLTFGKTLFVVSDPAGYGVYDMRDNNDFKPGEQLVIYTEPQGYGHGRDGAIYLLNLKLDFEIKNKAGESLAKQENFAAWALRSRVPNREFMGKVTYNLTGIEPGEYEVITTVRDQNSAKAGSFTMPFKIVP
jgi:hypothetical protein